MSLRRSSAVVVSRTGQEADATYGDQHGPQTWVCWASVTKVFAAGLCRALVEADELTWDMPAEELAGRSVTTPVTLEALVEHRSGLPRMLPARWTTPDPYREWTDDRFDTTVLDDLHRWVTEPVAAGPDAGYSNLGYAVLVRCLELRFGAPWVELLQQHVLDPLGVARGSMSVGSPTEPSSSGVTAVGATSLRGRRLDDWDVSAGPFSGAGGLCSTVPTMVDVLDRALREGSPLAPAPARHAWVGAGSRHEHAGALLRQGALVVVDTAKGSVAAAHSVGGLPGHGDRYARRALSEAVLRTAPADQDASR